jgi:hypothetical protein
MPRLRARLVERLLETSAEWLSWRIREDTILFQGVEMNPVPNENALPPMICAVCQRVLDMCFDMTGIRYTHTVLDAKSNHEAVPVPAHRAGKGLDSPAAPRPVRWEMTR